MRSLILLAGVIILMAFLTGCGGSIEVINNTDYKAKMRKITIFSDGDSNITEYDIKPNGGIILLGYKSNWTENSIERSFADISTLEFITANDTLTLNGKTRMVTFLKNHRKGILNQKIVIEIGN